VLGGVKFTKKLKANVYPNNKNKKKKNNNNIVKSKPLELFELAGKKFCQIAPTSFHFPEKHLEVLKIA
jgi:hypothetical protein